MSCKKEDDGAPKKSNPTVPLDTLQRLRSISTTNSINSDIDSIIYIYGDTGRMIGVNYLHNSDTTQIINNFIYDDENRLIRVDFWKDWSGGFFGKCGWTFNSKGQLISIDSSSTSSLRQKTEYTYSEGKNLLESIIVKVDVSPVYSPVKNYAFASWGIVKKWGSNGNPIEVIESKHERGNGMDSAYYQTVYMEYSANNLNKRTSYFDTVIYTTETFEYDGNGYLIKYWKDYANPSQVDVGFEYFEYNHLGKPEVIKKSISTGEMSTTYKEYVFTDIILYE